MGLTPFARWVRRDLCVLSSNPLVRTSDRLEAPVTLVVLGIALVAVSVAAQAGSLLYDAGVRTAEEQKKSRHPIEAVTVEASASLSADLDNPAYVRVQWRQGQQVRTAGVITPMATKAGEALTIWLDDTGKVVAAPQTTEDVRLSAAVAAVTVWLTLVAGGVLLAWVIRRALDRSRDRSWERELFLLTRNDDGWADRHH